MYVLPAHVPGFLLPPTEPPLCAVLLAIVFAYFEGPLCPTISAIYI
jgi:hypothetical protein